VINETELEFLQTVWSRRPLFTYIFFAVNIAIFVLMTLAGGTTNDSTLLGFGVKANNLIDQGQYWRFITPVFIHIGLLHLFFNSYALWMVGPQVEKLYGSARFVLLYVLTGIGGVLGSYTFRPEVFSAGASGAIFGLFGVLLVFGLRHRRHVPPFFSRALMTGVLPTILVNLVIGFSTPRIDNSAHIAGLISGMALAAVVPFERPNSSTPPLFIAVQYLLLAAVTFSFVQVGRHYDGPRVAFQNAAKGWGGFFGSRSTTQEFIDALNHAQNAFAASTDLLKENRNPDVSQTLPQLGKSIDELKQVPSLSARSDEFVAQLLALMQDQYNLLKDVERGGLTLAEYRRASDNSKKYQEIEQSLDEWVAAEGERYGIRRN
jgi:membrane associated rhomboid family serine protease